MALEGGNSEGHFREVDSVLLYAPDRVRIGPLFGSGTGRPMEGGLHPFPLPFHPPTFVFKRMV